jgi:hypothetical protein
MERIPILIIPESNEPGFALGHGPVGSGLSLGIAPSMLFEVVEVGGEPQVIVLMCGRLFL